MNLNCWMFAFSSQIDNNYMHSCSCNTEAYQSEWALCLPRKFADPLKPVRRRGWAPSLRHQTTGGSGIAPDAVFPLAWVAACGKSNPQHLQHELQESRLVSICVHDHVQDWGNRTYCIVNNRQLKSENPWDFLRQQQRKEKEKRRSWGRDKRTKDGQTFRHKGFISGLRSDERPSVWS